MKGHERETRERRRTSENTVHERYLLFSEEMKKLATAGDDECYEDQAFARTPYFFTFHTAFHML